MFLYVLGRLKVEFILFVSPTAYNALPEKTPIKPTELSAGYSSRWQKFSSTGPLITNKTILTLRTQLRMRKIRRLTRKWKWFRLVDLSRETMFTPRWSSLILRYLPTSERRLPAFLVNGSSYFHAWLPQMYTEYVERLSGQNGISLGHFFHSRFES